MSSLQTNDFAKRIVRAQESLKQLKATQIVGGDNMGYYEYGFRNMSYTIAPQNMYGLVLVFDCSSPFPLVSMEMAIYENGVYRPNPYTTNATAYGASPDSTCLYTFISQENISAALWENEVIFNIAGKQISVNNPNNYLYAILFLNRGNSNVTIDFRDIKIRASHSGSVFGEFKNIYEWWN